MSTFFSRTQLSVAVLTVALGLPAFCAFGQTVPSAQTGSSQPQTPPKKANSSQQDAAPTKQAKPSSKPPAKAKAVPAPAEQSVEPDKVLYERALVDIKKGRYIEGRLVYQTLINTYPDSEYLAKAKLGVADSYFKEGGTSNITQAVQEYKDFITFFPFLDEAAYAQLQVAMAHYRMMEKPDRDRTEAESAEDEFQTFLLKYPQSPLVPKAEQDLRDVQQVLADSQFRVASFYYLKMNYAASAARLMDLTERYPLYSQSDQALWLLGDIYERAKQASKNEDDKNHWADLAAECYQRLVKDYPLSQWADNARSQLKAMSMPVPASDPKAEKEMRAEQMYRKQHHEFVLIRFPKGMMKSSPDVILAARSGQPNLNPPDDAISATDVLKPGASGPSFNLAMRPAAPASENANDQGGAPVEAVPVASDSSGAPGNNLGATIIEGAGQSSTSQPDAAATAGAAGADAAAASNSSAPTITLQPVAGSSASSGSANEQSSAAQSQAAAPAPASQLTGPTNPPASSANSSDAQSAADTSTPGPPEKADKADSKTESTSKKKKGIHKVVPF